MCCPVQVLYLLGFFISSAELLALTLAVLRVTRHMAGSASHPMIPVLAMSCSHVYLHSAAHVCVPAGPPSRSAVAPRMVDFFCYHFMVLMDYRRAVGEWNVLQVNPPNVLAELEFAPSC